MDLKLKGKTYLLNAIYFFYFQDLHWSIKLHLDFVPKAVQATIDRHFFKSKFQAIMTLENDQQKTRDQCFHAGVHIYSLKIDKNHHLLPEEWASSVAIQV